MVAERWVKAPVPSAHFRLLSGTRFPARRDSPAIGTMGMSAGKDVTMVCPESVVRSVLVGLLVARPCRPIPMQLMPQVATCLGLTANIVGTQGDDTIYGTDGSDVIAGRGGNDTIHGLVGNDVVCRGDGNDNLPGGARIDYCGGGPGRCTMSDQARGAPDRTRSSVGNGFESRMTFVRAIPQRNL